MEKIFSFFLEIFLKSACRKFTAILEQNCKSKCWSACFKDYVVLYTKKKLFWTVSTETKGKSLEEIQAYFRGGFEDENQFWNENNQQIMNIETASVY